MREFAGLKLREAGEEEAVELRCAEYYRSRCRRSALEGRYRLLEWLEWADLEIDNVRAVLQRCLTHADAARGIDLAASLGWYWITRATTEGMRWLDEFLASGGGDPEVRGWAYFMRGFLAVLKADPAAARPALQAAVAAARQAGQPICCRKRCPWHRSRRTWPVITHPPERLLDEAHVTATGRAPTHPARSRSSRPGCSTASSRLISTQSGPPPRKERVSPGKRVTFTGSK